MRRAYQGEPIPNQPIIRVGACCRGNPADLAENVLELARFAPKRHKLRHNASVNPHVQRSCGRLDRPTGLAEGPPKGGSRASTSVDEHRASFRTMKS